MKTLGKLNINSEKLLKNEELLNLRGGYGESGREACCTTTSTSQGTLEFCSTDMNLLYSWCQFWIAAGHNPTCRYPMYA